MTKLFVKFMQNICFSKNLIHEYFAECNIRINCRICDNIDELIVITKTFSLYSRFVSCNVHINFRIRENIKILNIITMILLTWSNCSFHRKSIWCFHDFWRIDFANEIDFTTFRIYLFILSIIQFNVIQQRI